VPRPGKCTSAVAGEFGPTTPYEPRSFSEPRCGPFDQKAKMSASVIAVLRVVRIAFGAFWLGGAITVGFILLPGMRGRRPDRR
jgi:hypothetical protein